MTNSNASHEQLYYVNQLYRDVLIPRILGKDTSEILYWAGKKLAKHYALTSFDDLEAFFEQLDWGSLSCTSQKAKSSTFIISGQGISDRINSCQDGFNLEAGLIAQACELENQMVTEAEAIVDDKKQIVKIITRS